MAAQGTETTPLITTSLSAVAKPAPAKKSWFFSTIVKPTGFGRKRSLFYFLLLPTVFALFCAYKFPIIDIENVWAKNISPGEWYWFKSGYRRAVMHTHFACVMPAGVLMPIQFIPAMRRKYRALHRISGRIVLTLLMIGSLSALFVSPYTFGGSIATMSVVATLCVSNIYTIIKGYLAIRRRDIPAHRIWMIRTWGYTGSILTMRPLFVIFGLVSNVYSPNSWYAVSTCDQLIYLYKYEGLPIPDLISRYPACVALDPDLITNTTVPFAAAFGGVTVPGVEAMAPILVPVRAYFSTKYPEEIAAMLTLTFGPAFWVALLVHVVVTEWWLDSEKKAAEKKVVEERKKHAGAEKGGLVGKA